MFIKVFIRTREQEIADNIAKGIICCVPKDLVEKVNYRIEHYWKYDDTTIVEIQIELLKEFDKQTSNDFLNSISDKWIYLESGTETISSKTMDGGCIMKFDYIDMINISFS